MRQIISAICQGIPFILAAMCLILFAYRQHPEYPLVLIANRDEYYARPNRDAHWWEDADIYAGRDLEAGGTWLGVNRGGRIAAVTNIRAPGSTLANKRSRGALTRDFLAGRQTASTYLDSISGHDQEYSGFNLLLGDLDSLCFYSNRNSEVRPIEAGIYGVSNGDFDEPWPKLESGKQALAALLNGSIEVARLMNILTDYRIAEDHELPSTGVPLDVERMLSSRFIRAANYGTRACSVLLFDQQNRIHFTEQNYISAEQVGAHVHTIIEETEA